jgi:phenylalanine-4-hydroxylase
MRTYELQSNMKQEYDKYKPEDFEVWKILFERQMPVLKELASEEYLEGIRTIGFTAEKIPDFREMNEVLLKATGWSLVVVPGIIKESDFFDMLSKKQFPATTWLRKLSELDYLSEPDMFHDVFGHVPLLSHQSFCDFFHAIGNLGIRYKNKPEVLSMLGRIYWFTVEFGLIKSDEKLKIYGAGILSSHGETKFAISEKPEHKAFDAEEIMNTPFENDRIQEKYFVIGNFEDLYNSISSIEKVIESSLEEDLKFAN